MPYTRLCLLLLACLALPLAAQAAADLSTVGARTPFNAANALDLATYCDGTDNADDTACLGRWLSEARAQGKHLYVSSGTYHYSKGRAIFGGFHLRCASPLRSVFKALGDTHDLFVLAPNWGVTGEPWEDISIENCGFDLNGSTANFAGVIALVGGALPVRYVTIRDNLIFDSTQPGAMYMDGTRQRQYISVIKAEDVLVEHNHLAEGGRIKVGRPGRRVVIRHNTLHNINDNAITVVDQWGNLSSDFLIAHNTITNPLASGIFFGADGQKAGTADQTLRDVVVQGNSVAGAYRACVTGILPNHTAGILVMDTTCRKTGPTPAGVFTAGISLGRTNTSTLPADAVTVQGNRLQSDVPGAGATVAALVLSDHFTHVCLLGNTITGASTAIKLRSDMPQVRLLENNLGGGQLNLGPGVQVDPGTAVDDCYGHAVAPAPGAVTAPSLMPHRR